MSTFYGILITSGTKDPSYSQRLQYLTKIYIQKNHDHHPKYCLEDMKGGEYMGEREALIQRRKMLLENVSKIDYEVGKIDQRLASLDEIADSDILIGITHRRDLRNFE
jgi:hypothetical protein